MLLFVYLLKHRVVPVLCQKLGLAFSVRFHKLFNCNYCYICFTDYCASKFAAVGFAESISYEMKVLGKTGVKTTTVCPYFINTGMFDGCSTR